MSTLTLAFRQVVNKFDLQTEIFDEDELQPAWQCRRRTLPLPTPSTRSAKPASNRALGRPVPSLHLHPPESSRTRRDPCCFISTTPITTTAAFWTPISSTPIRVAALSFEAIRAQVQAEADAKAHGEVRLLPRCLVCRRRHPKASPQICRSPVSLHPGRVVLSSRHCRRLRARRSNRLLSALRRAYFQVLQLCS